MIKLVSWNVNGIRAVGTKGLDKKIQNMKADIICFQETKATEEQVKEVLSTLPEYTVYAHSAERKGYSGTAVATLHKPIEITTGMGIGEHDKEGRVITAHFKDYILVTVYTPNSGNELVRLPYRRDWDKAFRTYLMTLQNKKPVIVCGDLNVAHQPIDIARPKANYNKTPGYTQDEIDGMTRLLESGFDDTYRKSNPDTVAYSWWSYRGGARENNIGWRLDYFLADNRLAGTWSAPAIHKNVEGSDHCPVSISLNT